MVINEDDEPARGDDFSDLAQYIRDFQAGGYRVDEVTEAICARCGHRAFQVFVDDGESGGAVQRTCVGCGTAAFVADSAEYWDEAEPVECECPCGGTEFAVAAGFSLRPDGDVRWISVGLCCLDDGVMGVYEDWKIDYGPSAHLVDQA